MLGAEEEVYFRQAFRNPPNVGLKQAPWVLAGRSPISQASVISPQPRQAYQINPSARGESLCCVRLHAAVCARDNAGWHMHILARQAQAQALPSPLRQTDNRCTWI
ncbi:hypothetical protein AcW1_000552 [Taiwanofungus camphoratus]|nr:hypothetical protein AcW1_000552 [Antrodia cinnamomea]